MSQLRNPLFLWHIILKVQRQCNLICHAPLHMKLLFFFLNFSKIWLADCKVSWSLCENSIKTRVTIATHSFLLRIMLETLLDKFNFCDLLMFLTLSDLTRLTMWQIFTLSLFICWWTLQNFVCSEILNC